MHAITVCEPLLLLPQRSSLITTSYHEGHVPRGCPPGPDRVPLHLSLHPHTFPQLWRSIHGERIKVRENRAILRGAWGVGRSFPRILQGCQGAHRHGDLRRGINGPASDRRIPISSGTSKPASQAGLPGYHPRPCPADAVLGYTPTKCSPGFLPSRAGQGHNVN